MQLIAILGVLVAVNLGIVYVGSEATEDKQPEVEGVVEVESVDATAEEPAKSKEPQSVMEAIKGSEAEPQ